MAVLPEVLRESVWKRWLFAVAMLLVVLYTLYTRHFGAPPSNRLDSGALFGVTFGSDVVVLVRSGDAFGAFKLLAREGDTLRHAWIFREDGRSVLDPADPAVRAGESTSGGANPQDIAFGPFRVQWSEAAFGRTYLYYDHAPLDTVPPGALRLAATPLASFVGVDAADSRWLYRGALREDGCSGHDCR